MRRANVCFLLHMHQPEYVDPRTGIAELPWVRLHGARAYLDVAMLLDEHSDMRLTVNFVPSLVAQLEGVVAGAQDAWLRVAALPPSEWTLDQRELLVTRLFSLNWGREVETRPRYKELLEKRGRHIPAPGELRQRATTYSDQDLRDLTVLFYLSWIGFAARKGDAELDALEKKARNFTDEDFKLVVEKQRQACAKVLPLWRKLAERGQVELSGSPYYHPILPLVIDTDHARRARPDLPLPEHFAWAEDARAQLSRAIAKHTSAFGAPPVGMWPPEGSVSPEALAIYASGGVKWLATDEGNLWRSLALGGQPHGRGDLYRAYRHQGVDLVFRDREISDRIGFSYAHGDSRAGAQDLIARARACAEQSTAPHGEPALVPIFLDGENPWESYPGSGEAFLRALFEGLTHDEQLRPAQLRQHLADAPSRVELPQLHSGSWIDSDFHIWIGDPVKNRAWDLLGRTRRRFERARGSAPQEKLDAAYEHLLAAEGSDWFWWFGEPFHSAEDALFDRLFRSHLAGALQALGESVPEELDRPVAAQVAGAQSAPGLRPATALVHPRIGESGHHPSFYEWHGAAVFDVPRGAAMAETPLVERIHLGFDREKLYVRVDPSQDASLDGTLLDIELEHHGRRQRLRLPVTPKNGGSPHWTLAEKMPEGEYWRELGSGGPAEVLRSWVALSTPFARLDVTPGDKLRVAVRLSRGEVALARYPTDGWLEVSVPDDAFEAENWSV
jgi:alpha-amylase/alpha-mannosidase (GH57 family)